MIRKASKVKVPVYTTMEYRGSVGMSPLILNIAARLSRVVNMPWLLYPWERTMVPIQ